MNIVLWIMQIILAAVFAMAGYGKISNTKQQHIADGHIKPEASVIPIRILGVLEWLGCIGIIVPWLTNFFSVLTPIAALLLPDYGCRNSHSYAKERIQNATAADNYVYYKFLSSIL